jgi:hypothetical protein
MYYTQKSRSSIVIDPKICNPSSLHHGRALWFQKPGGQERELMYWDTHEKRVVSAVEFDCLRLARAAANRRKHALIPFSRKAKREAERYLDSLGQTAWVAP